MQKLKLLPYVIGINLLLTFMLQSCSHPVYWGYNPVSATNRQATQNNAALQEAAILGNIKLTKQLLAQGHDPTIADPDGIQPLHYAAQYGHIGIIALLLQSGVCPNIVDTYGLTPLHYATEGRQLEAIQFLLENKANPNIADRYGSMPLHLATNQGHLDAVKALVAKKAAVHIVDGNYDMPLHIATENGHAEIVAFFLDNFADTIFNDSEEDDNTPLHIAAKCNHKIIVKLLLEHGLDVNMTSGEYGNTALHLAAEEGHLEILKLLLASGADPTIKDFDQNSPLHSGANHGNPTILALLLARIEDLGVDSKAYINRVNAEGNTALHLAAQYGNLEAIELLLQRGAEIDSLNSYGYTPLGLAIQCSCSQVNLINLLLEHGSQVSTVEHCSLVKPLHQATHINHVGLISSFLEKGANISLQDAYGNSFLHIIAAKKNFNLLIEVLKTIENHKANLLTILQQTKTCSNCSDILTIIADYIYGIDFTLKNNQGESIVAILERHKAAKEDIALAFETLRKFYKIPNSDC
jgi:ankyrin repeat protein